MATYCSPRVELRYVIQKNEKVNKIVLKKILKLILNKLIIFFIFKIA